MSRTSCLAMLLLLLSPVHGLALDPTHDLAEYTFRSWTSRDGLPNTTVQDLAQTRDGYLWIATLEGLVRFDGARFTTFDRSNTPALPRNDVQTILGLRNGDLLLSAYGGGLVRYDGRAFVRQSQDASLGSRTITALEEGRGREVFVGTGTGLLLCGARGCHEVRPKGHPFDEGVSDLEMDAEGTLWIASAQGLFRMGGNRLEAVSLPLKARSVLSIKASDGAALWVGTDAGLVRLGDGSATLAVPTRAPVRALLSDRHGGLWFGAGDRLGRLQSGRLEWVSAAEGLSSGSVVALLQDREGSLWVGTTLGLTQVKHGPAVTFGQRHDLEDPELLAVAAVAPGAGELIVGTARGRIARFDGQHFRSRGGRSPFEGSRVLALLPETGRLWVGTDRGLYVSEGGSWKQDFGGHSLPRDSIRSLLRDRSGVLWIGTDGGGLVAFGSGEPRSFRRDQGMLSEQVRGLMERRDGSLLVATYGGIVDVRLGRTPEVIPIEGLREVMGRALHEDEEGVVWIGTYGEGLIRVQGGRVRTISSSVGLWSDVIYAIVDEGPRLWLSCNRGIFAISKAQVAAFLRGEVSRLTSEIYGREDGMASEEFSGGWPAGLRDGMGRLWFPTAAGLVMFDPARRSAGRVADPPLLEEVLVGGRPASMTALRIPPGGLRLEVRYTSVTFSAADRTHFSYRMKGLEDGWTDVDRRRFATYTNLPPGKYRFEVRARTEGGDWQPSDHPLDLEVEARWYESFLIRSLLAVALVVGITGTYIVRARTMSRRAIELTQRVEEAMARVKMLRGLLPICAGCKKIRQGDGYWRQLEAYIRDNSEADFSHGMCPDCASRWFPDRQDTIE